MDHEPQFAMPLIWLKLPFGEESLCIANGWLLPATSQPGGDRNGVFQDKNWFYFSRTMPILFSGRGIQLIF
jgi:hypothetical protein